MRESFASAWDKGTVPVSTSYRPALAGASIAFVASWFGSQSTNTVLRPIWAAARAMDTATALLLSPGCAPVMATTAPPDSWDSNWVTIAAIAWA